MKVYRLIQADGEIRKTWKDMVSEDEIFNALFGNNSDPVEIARFDNNDDAMAELRKHKCEIWESGSVWRVSGYAVEAFEADDDGEFLSGSDYDMAVIEY